MDELESVWFHSDTVAVLRKVKPRAGRCDSHELWLIIRIVGTDMSMDDMQPHNCEIATWRYSVDVSMNIFESGLED